MYPKPQTQPESKVLCVAVVVWRMLRDLLDQVLKFVVATQHTLKQSIDSWQKQHVIATTIVMILASSLPQSATHNKS